MVDKSEDKESSVRVQRPTKGRDQGTGLFFNHPIHPIHPCWTTQRLNFTGIKEIKEIWPSVSDTGILGKWPAIEKERAMGDRGNRGDKGSKKDKEKSKKQSTKKQDQKVKKAQEKQLKRKV